MKPKDLLFIAGVTLFFSPFFFSDVVLNAYQAFNRDHGLVMGGLKFAVLATLGEVIGLRIRTGHYTAPNFGILPRAIVWGLLGVTIAYAFIVFPAGTIRFLAYLGLPVTTDTLKGGVTGMQILTAFAVSVGMNLIFAPWMMTIHKITDEHIARTGGTLRGLFRPLPFGEILASLNWQVQWNFVFKKTIPLFWIPAHTVTFLLPEQYRVLFAALLSVVLGVFLAIASLMGKNRTPSLAS